MPGRRRLRQVAGAVGRIGRGACRGAEVVRWLRSRAGAALPAPANEAQTGGVRIDRSHEKYWFTNRPAGSTFSRSVRNRWSLSAPNAR